MISKMMLAQCQNVLGQAFEFLPEDVQRTMIAHKEHVLVFAPCKDGRAQWLPARLANIDNPSYWQDRVLRLSPDTPTLPESSDWFDTPVNISELGFYEACVPCCEGPHDMFIYAGHSRFLGIVYERDGVETLRTSVDAAFGVPKRVRFHK